MLVIKTTMKSFLCLVLYGNLFMIYNLVIFYFFVNNIHVYIKYYFK